MGYYILTLAIVLAINAIIVSGLNVQYGFAGVLNFGYIAFVAIGAYVAAVTSLGNGNPNFVQSYILHWNLPWPLPVIMGGLAAALLGCIMAFIALRSLRSDYLAIATIALSQVLWTVIGNATPLFNGWQGVAGVPRPFSGLTKNASAFNTDLFFLIIVLVIGALIYLANRMLYRSPLGRVMRGVREDEAVVETFGRQAFKIKFIAFTFGCFIAGIGGALLVEYQSAYGTQAWLPLETFVIWAAMIVGGTGNNGGAVIGAAVVMVGINEMTRFLPSSISPEILEPLRGVLIGVIMLLVLKFMPSGVLSERRIRLYTPRRRRMEASLKNREEAAR